MPSARTLLAAAATIVALAAAGCGLGASSTEPRQVSLLVSSDYGHGPPGGARERAVEVSGAETAAGLLAREHVDVAAGGSLLVNGMRPDDPPARTRLHRGDRVWWDAHRPGAARVVQAAVGSFPEPFVHGRDGRRIPARLECADVAETACDVAERALVAAGVDVVARARIGTVPGERTLVILVGLWPDLRADFAARQLERGPRTSGVYVRVAPGGRSLALLDARGRVARTLRSGAGLVAATRFQGDEPTWVVTGTDRVGLRDAAGALSADALDGAFAVALSEDVPSALPIAAR
jgi:hypothetical protein